MIPTFDEVASLYSNLHPVLPHQLFLCLIYIRLSQQLGSLFQAAKVMSNLLWFVFAWCLNSVWLLLLELCVIDLDAFYLILTRTGLFLSFSIRVWRYSRAGHALWRLAETLLELHHLLGSIGTQGHVVVGICAQMLWFPLVLLNLHPWKFFCLRGRSCLCFLCRLGFLDQLFASSLWWNKPAHGSIGWFPVLVLLRPNIFTNI